MPAARVRGTARGHRKTRSATGDHPISSQGDRWLASVPGLLRDRRPRSLRSNSQATSARRWPLCFRPTLRAGIFTTSDRSLIAARLATLKRGSAKGTNGLICRSERPPSISRSRRAVSGGPRKLLERGSPELIARVAAHELSVSAAERLLPPPAQPRVVAEGYTVKQWRALPEDERAALLVHAQPEGAAQCARVRRRRQRHRLGELLRSARSPVAGTVARTATSAILYRSCRCSTQIGWPRRSTSRRQ